MAYRIPFNKPGLTGREIEYVRAAVQQGQVSGDGAFTARCHAILQDLLGAARVLLTTSCTHALEMAALLLRVGPGDEVIVPTFTFVSTANAFVSRGARPIFADIRADTLNLDESKLPALLTPRTKVVVPVHYAGVSCEMDPILELSRAHGFKIVEDNAHGLFGSYRGRPLGSFGSLATQSFHETKNVHCGEGGALVINDPALIERAEIVREKGTNRSRFFRGQVDKYTWVDEGSSWLPSDLLAAYLCAQLEEREHIQSRRQRAWTYYYDRLRGWIENFDVRLPVVPSHCVQPYHLFYLILPDMGVRTALIDHLKGRGILSVFHYLPLHLSAMGLRFGGRPGACPTAESLSDRLLRLPLYPDLTEVEQQEVVTEVRRFFGQEAGS